MDLFILVADKNIEYALKGALERYASLRIREIDFTIRVHTGRDGGARTTGADILALERNRYSACLLIFDFEGSGSDAVTGIELEQTLDEQLADKVGLRSKAIVIEPECDIWVWGSDNALFQILEWPKQEGIRAWLSDKGYVFDANGKPLRPKEALQELLFAIKRPRSSALYKRITSQISLARCTDPAFHRLHQSLMNWFPIAQPPDEGQ